MLTRAQVAARLGVSRATVRRLEQCSRLNPSLDAEGVHRFDVNEVEELARERMEGASLHAPEISSPNSTRNDELAERRRKLELEELELRAADVVDRKAERLRKARRMLEREHRETYGELRAEVLGLWRDGNMKNLLLMTTSELRDVLVIVVPMTQDELDAIPSYELRKRVEAALRAASALR